MKKLNNSKIIFILLTLIFGNIGCTDDQPFTEEPFDYVMFGHFYGFCVGEECVEIFKLEGDILYEDTLDSYPSYKTPYVGGFVELSGDLYNLVSDIPSLIPSELIETSKSMIGCPDCSDGGGVFIQISMDNEIKYWMIDQFLDNVPEELHSIVKTINSRIDLLQ